MLIVAFPGASIEWICKQIRLGLSQEPVKQSPQWDAVSIIDRLCDQQLLNCNGWPGYGW